MRRVVAPINRSKKELDRMIGQIDQRQGDLTQRITITNNDEIGDLGKWNQCVPWQTADHFPYF